MFKAKWSLTRIVITILILITTLVLVIFGAGSFFKQQKKLHHELNEELEAVSSQIASSMALPLWNLDFQQVDEIVKSIMQNRRVYAVTICEQSTETCNSWFRNKDWKVATAVGEVSDTGLLKKVQEINFEDQYLGRFEVTLTPKFVDQELYNYLVRTAINILILNVLLVTILAFILQKLVLKPLKILERYAVGVQMGDVSADVLEKGRFFGELESLAFSFGNMTNRLEYRIKLETIISDISQRFIDVSPREVEDAVDWVLKTIGVFLNVDRVYLYRLTDDGRTMFITNEWSRRNVDPQINRLRGIPKMVESWPIRDMVDNESVCFACLEDQPLVIVNEVNEWRGRGIQSLLCMAMRHAQSLRGFMGLESVRDRRSWSEEEVQLIRLINEIISNTLERQRAEKELETINAHLEELVDDRTRELAQKAQDLAEAMEQAQEANKTKNEFLARMSHEIRTPMNAIIGLTNLTLKTGLNKSQEDYLVKVRDSSRHLLSIINDILDFSKIEADRLELDKRDFMLNHVIDRVADMFGERSAGKGVELYYIIDRLTPLSLKGDSLRLGQILINLIANAVKFTDRGEVVVRVKPAEESAPEGRIRLLFSISDTGIGIPGEMIDYLFQPFTQIDGSVTRKYEGTGLGLSICRRLVEMMDGRIWVESQVGRGSTFFFTIMMDSPEKDKDYILTLPQDLRGLKTMIVDDNETGRLIMREVLQSFDFNVVSACSGQEILNLLKSKDSGQPFDLVILDWMMPEMNGFALAQKINNYSLMTGARRPKIIMVTMYGRDDFFREKRKEEAGIDGFLQKPINSSELFNVVLELFGREEAVIKRKTKKAEAFDQEELKGVAGARILLVEDNTLNQDVAKALLEGAGLLVDCAENGRNAVSMLQERADSSTPLYDAVLMDIEMPEMDGYQAAKTIRLDPRFQNLPVIAMTAHALKGDREKCLEAGMNDYVAKPIEERELYSALLRWIEPGDRDIGKSELIMAMSREEPWEGMPVDIFGLDLGVGLEHIQGNTGLYKKILRNFRHKYQGAVEEISAYIAENKIDEAERLTHSIKGVAGNIGASGLFSAAKNLDDALKQEKTEDLETLLDLFNQSLTQILASLNSLETEPGTPAAEEFETADLANSISILRGMKGLLENNSTRARRGLSPLKKILWNTSFREQLDSLDKAVYLLDSERALSIIIEMSKGLNILMNEGNK